MAKREVCGVAIRRSREVKRCKECLRMAEAINTGVSIALSIVEAFLRNRAEGCPHGLSTRRGKTWVN